MANAVPVKTKQAFWDGLIDVVASGVKAYLVEIGGGEYIYDDANHDALADIPAGSRIIESGNLLNKTITDGVFDADDIFVDTSTQSGRICGAIVLIQDGGTEALSLIVAYIDTGLGLPFTTNGNGVNLRWANTASRIARIT